MRSQKTVLNYKLLHDDAQAPFKKHDNDAGFDLCAVEDVVIAPGETKIVKLGVGFDIPKGHMLQLCARSSISKKGLIIVNGVGVIDEGYKGEVAIALYNQFKDEYRFLTMDRNQSVKCHDPKPVKIEKGERIAQVVLIPVVYPQLNQVDDLQDSERADGGFGSTGK